MDMINNINNQNRILDSINDHIISAFQTYRNDQSSLLLNLNGIILSSEEIEQNVQIVNDIYLNTFAQGICEFNEDQINYLHDVAIQCPYSGGAAVYKARSMYFKINP